MGLRDALKKVLDPSGPLGAILSPSDVYKERAGLPVTSPHRQRVDLPAPPEVHEAMAIVPRRFVVASEAVGVVPRDRVRQVSAHIEEHWVPQYAATKSTDMVEILRASETLLGWWVTQKVAASARARPKLSAEQFVEVAQSAQIQASDAFYVGFAETIPGNDSIVVDGKTLTGGTFIRSRQHHAEVTKNMCFWDEGFVRERNAALAEMDSRPVRNVRANLEKMAGEVLPTWRRVANPRAERRAV